MTAVEVRVVVAGVPVVQFDIEPSGASECVSVSCLHDGAVVARTDGLSHSKNDWRDIFPGMSDRALPVRTAGGEQVRVEARRRPA